MAISLDWRDQLSRRLASTSAAVPRPLVPLDIPAEARRRLLDDRKLAALRPASVLVPIVDRGAEPAVLLTVRSGSLRRHAGQVSFPGGRVDPDDRDAAGTALREAHEEVALHPRHVRVIGYLDDYPTVTGFRVTPVVGIVSAEAVFRPDRVEVDEVFEVPLSFVLDPDNYRQGELEREGMRLPYWGLRHDGRLIWGATAAMLRDMMLKVGVP